MQYNLSTLPTSEDSVEVKGLNFSIIKYKKENLNANNLDTLGLFRSVIVEYADADATTGEKPFRPVSFSPPKSIPTETFVAAYTLQDCVIEEFIDGTMINIFWSEVANEWIINTKSNIGANSHFFVFPVATSAKSQHTKSFRDMFFDAIGPAFDFSIFDKSCSYSFVLQHPMNRLVSPVYAPAIYLVGIYRLDGPLVIPLDIHSHFNTTTPVTNSIKKPQVYSSTSYEDLQQRFAGTNPQAPTPYNVMGIVVKHPATGHRTKFRNPAYEYVKQLRGNNPRLDYRYMELRKSNKVKEFLRYYPECVPLFSEYRHKIHTFTQHLYKNYVDCYILKKNKLSYFSTQYKTNMYNLHRVYLSTYKPEGQYVTFGSVVKFVNSLDIPLLLHSINYDIVQSQKVHDEKEKGITETI
jgi:hypothetical protein